MSTPDHDSSSGVMPSFNTQSAEGLPYTNPECHSQSLISPSVTSVAENAEAKHSINPPLDESDPGLRACSMTESHFEVNQSGSRYSHVTLIPSSLEPLSEEFEVFTFFKWPTWSDERKSWLPGESVGEEWTARRVALYDPGAGPKRRIRQIPSEEDLIADVDIFTSRLLVTKTHCLYTENILGYRSCLLGFRTVFHPYNDDARIKRVVISLSLFPGPTDPGSQNPIIKAIHPSQGVVHTVGEPTTVHHGRDTSFGLSLGVNAYGKVDLTHTRSQSRDTTSSGSIFSSGIETNKLLLTLQEDRQARVGVLRTLDFAVLLYLPSSNTRAFEARLTVKSRRRSEFPLDPRGWGPTSKTWIMQYDGMAELGRPTLTQSPDGSRNLFSVSNIESG